MFLAKVIGHVVAPQKCPELGGMSLMMIQPHITRDGAIVVSGSSIVAVDCVGAGLGECVLFTQGSSARLTQRTKGMPIDAVIVGIVDTVEVEGKVLNKP